MSKTPKYTQAQKYDGRFPSIFRDLCIKYRTGPCDIAARWPVPITAGMIANWGSGTHEPSYRNLIRLQAAIGCTWDDLFPPPQKQRERIK